MANSDLTTPPEPLHVFTKVYGGDFGKTLKTTKIHMDPEKGIVHVKTYSESFWQQIFNLFRSVPKQDVSYANKFRFKGTVGVPPGEQLRKTLKAQGLTPEDINEAITRINVRLGTSEKIQTVALDKLPLKSDDKAAIRPSPRSIQMTPVREFKSGKPPLSPPVPVNQTPPAPVTQTPTAPVTQTPLIFPEIPGYSADKFEDAKIEVLLVVIGTIKDDWKGKLPASLEPDFMEMIGKLARIRGQHISEAIKLPKGQSGKEQGYDKKLRNEILKLLTKCYNSADLPPEIKQIIDTQILNSVNMKRALDNPKPHLSKLP